MTAELLRWKAKSPLARKKSPATTVAPVTLTCCKPDVKVPKVWLVPATEMTRAEASRSVEFQLTWVVVEVTDKTEPSETLTLPLASSKVPACAPVLDTTATEALLTPALKSPAVIQALAPEAKTLISVASVRWNEKLPLTEKVPAIVACKPTTLTTGEVSADMAGMTCEKPSKLRVLVVWLTVVVLSCRVAEVALADAKSPPVREKPPVASSQ